MDLTDDEIRQILDLIDNSSFDFLELEIGDMKLTVSKGGHVPEQAPKDVAAAPPPPPTEPAADRDPGPPVAADVDTAGRTPITAPMVGTFYAAPKPGAPPFVQKGARVTPETTVGLIEVMKVFTGIQAGVDGVIDEILVSDSEFVEYGRVLFLVEADGGGA